jgi:mono/diheme cytochrome c family protein
MRRVIQFVTVLALAIPGAGAVAGDNRVARGEYLVRLGGCNDCHTPGYFLGKPDSSRFLGGSDVGFDVRPHVRFAVEVARRPCAD